MIIYIDRFVCVEVVCTMTFIYNMIDPVLIIVDITNIIHNLIINNIIRILMNDMYE